MTPEVRAAPAHRPTGFPPVGRAHAALLVLALVGFVTSMDISMTTLLIEPMKRELGLSDVQIGLLQGTAYGLAYGLGSMPLGRLIDSRTRTRLMVIGVLVWAAAMSATGLAHDVGLLLVCRAALGLVAALLVPASISLVADLFAPQRRTVATSLFTVGQALGQGVGILVGGILFDLLARRIPDGATVLGALSPWRALYLGAAAVSLLLLPLLLALREPSRQERDGDVQSVGVALRRLWAYRAFIGPLLAALLFAVIPLQAALVWASPMLIRRFGQSPGQFAGWLSAIILAGGILGTLAGGRAAELGRRRGGPRGVLLPALLAMLTLVPLSLFGLSPNVPLFAAMLALELFCAGVIQTVGVIAFTLNIPNEIRGMGLGIYALVVALFGTATAPAAIAFVSRALGGESRLGAAIAVVSMPSALLAALFISIAMRGEARRRFAGSLA